MVREAGPRPGLLLLSIAVPALLAGALTALLVLPEPGQGSPAPVATPPAGLPSVDLEPPSRTRRPARPIGISIPAARVEGPVDPIGAVAGQLGDPPGRQGRLVQGRPASGGAGACRDREPRGLTGRAGALRQPANAATAHAHPRGGSPGRHPPVPAGAPPPDREEPVPARPDLRTVVAPEAGADHLRRPVHARGGLPGQRHPLRARGPESEALGRRMLHRADGQCTVPPDKTGLQAR